MNLLLENGAQPDFGDEDGQTPLSRAVGNRSVAVVQLLPAKEVIMDFNCNFVSECHPYPSESLLDLMPDTVILDYCRV